MRRSSGCRSCDRRDPCRTSASPSSRARPAGTIRPATAITTARSDRAAERRDRPDPAAGNLHQRFQQRGDPQRRRRWTARPSPGCASRPRELDAAVTGSVQICATDDGVFNRLLFATPDGALQHYDKRHLFRIAKEHERYAAGRDRADGGVEGLAHLSAGLLRPALPGVLAQPLRRRARRAASTTTCCCTSPTGRRRARTRGRRCCAARAIENLCYVAGVNRVGVDGNGLHYSGDSAVLDFLGSTLVELGDEEVAATTVLSGEALLGHRERFPAMLDGDAFSLGAERSLTA